MPEREDDQDDQDWLQSWHFTPDDRLIRQEYILRIIAWSVIAGVLLLLLHSCYTHKG